MAIIFDGHYHKITKNTANFKNKTTEIEMQIYSSQNTRDREKVLRIQAKNFIERVQSFLMENMNSLIQETNQIQPIDTILDREKFLSLYPSIKIKADEVAKMQEEGLFLIDNVLESNISIDKLNFLNKWKELGFSEEFCKKIDILGTMTISVEGVFSNDMNTLYNETKKKIVSLVVDC